MKVGSGGGRRSRDGKAHWDSAVPARRNSRARCRMAVLIGPGQGFAARRRNAQAGVAEPRPRRRKDRQSARDRIGPLSGTLSMSHQPSEKGRGTDWTPDQCQRGGRRQPESGRIHATLRNRIDTRDDRSRPDVGLRLMLGGVRRIVTQRTVCADSVNQVGPSVASLAVAHQQNPRVGKGRLELFHVMDHLPRFRKGDAVSCCLKRMRRLLQNYPRA